MKVVRLAPFTLALFLLFLLRAVSTQVSEKVLNRILWLKQSLSEIVEVPDVLNRVVSEGGHVLFGDEHDRDYSVIEDVLDERLELVHRVFLLGCGRCELDAEREGF